MENKNDILTNLAIISDLFEKLPVDAKSRTLLMEVSKVEFDKVLDYVQLKYQSDITLSMDKINSFSITIGKVDIVFNTSNV